MVAIRRRRRAHGIRRQTPPASSSGLAIPLVPPIPPCCRTHCCYRRRTSVLRPLHEHRAAVVVAVAAGRPGFSLRRARGSRTSWGGSCGAHSAVLPATRHPQTRLARRVSRMMRSATEQAAKGPVDAAQREEQALPWPCSCAVACW